MQYKAKEFLYISNLLSLSRILLTIPWAYLISLDNEYNHLLLIVLSVVIILTDSFDGYFARKFNQITDLGIVLDPIADKIAMAVGMISLIIYRHFPLPLVILLVYRDLMILLIGWIALRRMKKPIMANFFGKLNTTVVSATVFLAVIDLRNELFVFFAVCSYLTILISAVSYARLAEKILFKKVLHRVTYYGLGFTLSILVVLFCLRFNWI